MIWTIYEMVRRTPKRKAVGSNPARDARLNAENHWFIRVFGFSYFLRLPEHPKDKALANGLANAISEDCKERRLLCVQSLLFMSANFVSKDRVDLQTNRGALQTRPQNLQKNLLTKKVIGHNTIPFKRRKPLIKWEAFFAGPALTEHWQFALRAQRSQGFWEVQGFLLYHFRELLCRFPFPQSPE